MYDIVALLGIRGAVLSVIVETSTVGIFRRATDCSSCFFLCRRRSMSAMVLVMLPELKSGPYLTTQGSNLFRTPNTETQEYSRNMIGIQPPGTLHSVHIRALFLGFPIWSSHLSPFVSDP